MHKLLPASLALAMIAPLSAWADPPADIKALRQEIEALRNDYEARLQTMEQRLKAAETAASQVRPEAKSEPQIPVPAAPTGSGTSAANSFNPSIALILSGTHTRTSQNPNNYQITGFPLPANSSIGPSVRGFSLAETELDMSANIDPWLRGATNISLHPDNSVSVEEAYVQTTSLGNGFTLKAGRFFPGIGYLNSQHSHTWDFVDNPLAYQAMLGTQYGDDGVQLKWLAPMDHYLELGLELGRGRSFPGSDTNSNGAGMTALTAHTGGDIGDSQSWRAGVSLLSAKASDQSLTSVQADGTFVTSVFNGSTRVWVVDAIWKWAPNGNATRTNAKLQAEYLQSTRNGSFNDIADYRTVQSGWYLQGVYQFMPSWRVGLRTERLTPDAVDSVYRPSKNSLMLDFNPSEFSRIRLQFARDKAREGYTDNQLSLQYQMSLGAHGAHSY